MQLVNKHSLRTRRPGTAQKHVTITRAQRLPVESASNVFQARSLYVWSVRLRQQLSECSCKCSRHTEVFQPTCITYDELNNRVTVCNHRQSVHHCFEKDSA